jgi:hypothetical protein
MQQVVGPAGLRIARNVNGLTWLTATILPTRLCAVCVVLANLFPTPHDPMKGKDDE